MKYRTGIFFLLLFGFLFLFLQQTNAYHFFFIEQNQLFLFTGHYFTETVSSPGGFAVYISHFLLQFFIVPYAGTTITAGLLTLAAFLTALLCKRTAPGKPLYLLYSLPALLLLFVHFNFNYHIDGTVAFLLTLLFLYIHTGISSPYRRLAYAVLSVPLLYWLGGPVVNLYGACILLWEILFRKRISYLFILPLAEAVLLSLGSVWLASVGEYRSAFLPDVYLQRGIKPPAVIYFSWLSLPAIITAARLLGNYNLDGRKSVKRETITTLLQVTAIAGIAAWGLPKYMDTKSAYLKELNYLTRTKQWDKIIDGYEKKTTTYLNLCYLNMALAEKGELAERMFSFDQRNKNGLMVPRNRSASISSLLSDIQFTVGNIAVSQQMAFENNVMGTGNNPYMLQRLVQTNLIYGAYPVAEKYIDILDRSLFYRGWARDHRRFLYNDQAVDNDPLLGLKRRNLVTDNYLSHPLDRERDFFRMAESGPGNSTAAEYIGAAYLLDKNLSGFREFVEKYYGTELMPVLPKSYQEAVLLAYEKEPGSPERFQIPQEVVKRFSEYKEKVIAGRSSGINPMNQLQPLYGDTYWFFLMFK